MFLVIRYVKDGHMVGSVKSATRAIDVLRYFEQKREPTRLNALCRDLGFPQSSTTALLKTLTVMGFLSYNIADRTYFPTLKVNAIGGWIPAALFGSGQILEAVERIHASTRETVVVVFKNDIYVQYIIARLSSHPIRHHVDEGSMRPMTSTVLGWLLMSTLKDSQVDNIIRRCNIAAGLPVSANVPDILRNVRLAREQGYAYGENAPSFGGATVGVVVPTTIQGQPVVIGCGGVLERVRENREHYLAVLRREVAILGQGFSSVN